MTDSEFWNDRTQSTNAAFRRFVKAPGYITIVEHTLGAAMDPAPSRRFSCLARPSFANHPAGPLREPITPGGIC